MVSTSEMVILLAFYHRYARKGLALFYLGQIDDARAAYLRGMQYEPENEALRNGTPKQIV